jgi:hypothetical protein
MRRRLSCEGSAGPLRRGVQALHTVLLFRLSPKWGMNLLNLESYTDVYHVRSAYVYTSVMDVMAGFVLSCLYRGGP